MTEKDSETHQGSNLFIVDNSADETTVHRYLRDWCQFSDRFDIATGNFEIGSLLGLDGEGTAKNCRPGTSGFRPVPEEVWNFHIGGYQVCEKWLKDRGPKRGKPGRTLSKDDIAHYHKIVIALTETIRIMGEIDEVIDQHGGWPDAFTTAAAALPKVAEDSAGYSD